jgi:hypothetical protein
MQKINIFIIVTWIDDVATWLTILLSLIIFNLKFRKSGLDQDNTGFKWRSVIVGSSRIWDDVINKFIPPPVMHRVTS